jgi:hypothetical protein
MPGSPQKRARREALGIITPKHGQLPSGWSEWSNDKRLEFLLQCSLTTAAIVLQWDVNTLPPFQLAVWNECRKHTWNVMLKISERQLDREAAERFRQVMIAVQERDLKQRGEYDVESRPN